MTKPNVAALAEHVLVSGAVEHADILARFAQLALEVLCYANHPEACEHVWGDPRNCDCGFRSARAALEAEFDLGESK